ncbi:MAG: NPCBM/NEW2 domain-containing protein [Lentisphaeraceae bacterium]|nr:NPCBM/NEW2 domain-containing protein [Lentisphaeraceae bacterium]
MNLQTKSLFASALLFLSGVTSQAQEKNGTLYESKLLTKYETVDVSVDVSGKKKIILTITDGEGDHSFDHAMVLKAKLTGPKGTLSLNKKWQKAKTSWGKIEIGKNPDGSPLKLGKKIIKDGFGAHAHAVFEFEVPEGYTTFSATAGLAKSSRGKGSIKVYLSTKKIVPKVAQKLLSPESFKTMDDLEVTVWATSPMFYNPTNMDIDSKGRIWVAEGVNYRNFRKPIIDVKHQQGDRIMVLEDTDNDGKADSSHVFVQDKEITAPLGVAVIGNKVIVSQPPSLIMYTDVDGDAKFNPEIDKKENFLTGFTGYDHDHSLHSVTFGPDGEYYFNQGNAGFSQVTDKSGKTIRVGSSYRGGSPYLKSNTPGAVSDDGFVYVGGFACRVKPDGTGLTVIGHNFRNSYEQTVSSYGDVFQNDNDDPPACRTTWLMEYGNAGFASADGKKTWRADQRPGQDVPTAEWRQEDPGTIPSGDIYGGGAPTGIVLYENGALGEKYSGMLLSCESARSVVFGYFPKPHEAGFKLDRFDFFDSSVAKKMRNWFRPADVSVGADGAIYVADWFDPGVGGHRMADRTGSGTIYRIAPKGFKPVNPEFDLNTTEGMIAALKSPAPNVRAIGFIKLKEQGAKSIPALKELLNDKNHYFRARAVWLLAQINDEGKAAVESLLSHEDPQTRIVAYRALRREGHKFMAISNRLSADPSIAVRREVALAMRNLSLEQSKDILLKIAEQYDGKDRWYLEALGTGCAKKEKEMYQIIHAKLGSAALKWSKAFADIAWRLHPEQSLADFTTRALSKEISYDERKRALTAIGFMKSKAAAEAMLTAALTGPEDLKETAAWWIKNKNSGDWASYKLAGKLKAKEVPKKTFDISKHLTKDNGNLPTIKKLLTMKGDAKNGEKLFHSKAICFSCHKIGNKGKQLGPELTGIGKRFEASVLLDSLINPSSAISFGFEGTMIETKDGKSVTGFLISDSDPVIIKDLAGNQTSIALKNIKKREVMKTSIMPSVKNLGLSAQEVVDVLEFLKKN